MKTPIVIRKKIYSLIFVSVFVVIASSCNNEKTEELTTQNRYYVPDTTEDYFDDEITVSELYDDNILNPEKTVDQDYLDELADRLNMDRDEMLMDYGLIYLIQAVGDDIPYGLSRAYPDIDFNQNSLKLDDYEYENVLVLNSALCDSEKVIHYNEIDSSEVGHSYDFDCSIQFKSIDCYSSFDELDNAFIQSEHVNEMVEYNIDNHVDDQRKYGSYIEMEVEIKNNSDSGRLFFLNDKGVYVNYGEIGIYSIMLECGEFLDFTADGGEKGTGKSSGQFYLDAGESSDVKMLYALFVNTRLDDIYIKLESFQRFGAIYDDGTYHPNSDPGLKLYKVEVDNH